VNFVPLVSAINKLRTVPTDCDTVVTARDLGISFGE
jgi:6-phosphofructokinase 1